MFNAAKVWLTLEIVQIGRHLLQSVLRLGSAPVDFFLQWISRVDRHVFLGGAAVHRHLITTFEWPPFPFPVHSICFT